MIRRKDIKKLINYAGHFAMMMNDDDIEKVIVEFVDVKLQRDRSRRKANKCQKGSNLPHQ